MEPRRERWQQRHRRQQQQWPRRRHLRSVSKEKWVETLVVADTKMVEFHGQPHVESYVLTVMNMVSSCWVQLPPPESRGAGTLELDRAEGK